MRHREHFSEAGMGMSAAVQAMFMYQGFLRDNLAFMGQEKEHDRVSTAYTCLDKWTELLGSAADFCWQLELNSWQYFECEVSEKFGHWLRDNLDAPIETGVQEIVRLVKLFVRDQYPLTDIAVARMCSDIYAAAARRD